jgi:hypothetical protein
MEQMYTLIAELQKENAEIKKKYIKLKENADQLENQVDAIPLEKLKIKQPKTFEGKRDKL